jgi:hypothetical protein
MLQSLSEPLRSERLRWTESDGGSQRRQQQQQQRPGKESLRRVTRAMLTMRLPASPPLITAARTTTAQLPLPLILSQGLSV